jgi:hypothetical protein
VNRHPVDQLADVRAQIKQLRAREDELRAEVLANPEDRAGDEHEAMLCETTVERVDLELMKRELGMLFLRPFLRQQVQTSVRLKPRQTKKRSRTT